MTDPERWPVTAPPLFDGFVERRTRRQRLHIALHTLRLWRVYLAVSVRLRRWR
jgi:hypothetical protein